MNATGLIISFLFIGAVVGLGIFMAAKRHVDSEVVRKFIHIGVSNWWFILLWAFADLTFALIGPIVFIVANAAAVFSGAAGILGVHDRRRNLGLVYFPISLTFLIMGYYLDAIPQWAATIGALTMGYADGLAALVGKKWGKAVPIKVSGNKSVLGSAIMFAVTLAIVATVGQAYALPQAWSAPWLLKAVLIALVATLLEAYTPWGLDNLSVPLASAALAAWIF
jgi:phytol kinase